MGLLRDLIDSVLFSDRDVHAIPVLDGAFSPNSRLDAARPLGTAFQRPDDLAVDAKGVLYVSTEDCIVRCTGPDYTERHVFARLAGQVGGLACTADGRVVACVAGTGVVMLSPDGRVLASIGSAAGQPIHCPTAVLVAHDGTMLVTDGSRPHPPQDWLVDLMECRPPSGRLIAIDADGGTRVLADGLHWPAGIAAAHGGGEYLVTESWAHRLVAVPMTGGTPRVVVKNFAGYPARIAPDDAGGYWLAFFGMRTQLIEFVLREPEFRESMMAKVPRELWIGPSLEGRFDYREPTQIGRIKKLGIQKPWAPPRSYGLVARLDAHGDTLESLHSRVDGRMHGATSVRHVRGRTLAALKGRDLLVELPVAARTEETP